MVVRVTFDPAKRQATLAARGLDFIDAVEVFQGETLDLRDQRSDYGEERIVSVGYLRGRMVVVLWTERDGTRRIISMRKANEREQARYGKRLSEG